jgi:hypothetical protein
MLLTVHSITYRPTCKLWIYQHLHILYRVKIPWSTSIMVVLSVKWVCFLCITYRMLLVWYCHASHITDVNELNDGNWFAGGNRSSDRRNQIFANRYYLWLWSESQPCCGFRTGNTHTHIHNVSPTLLIEGVFRNGMVWFVFKNHLIMLSNLKKFLR